MSKPTTIGELSRTRGQLEVEWIIPDFLSLPQKVDYYLESPEFYFCGATWNLRVYPNGTRYYATEGWIGLFIVKRESDPIVSLEYKLGMNKGDGAAYIKSSNSNVFDNEYLGWGSPKFLFRAELLEQESELLPSGALISTCCLTYDNSKDVAKIDQLSADLEKLMYSGKGTDVTVRVNGGEFKLHKNILRVRIPVFDAMFQHDMKEKATGIVTIDDCEAETFQNFVEYVYTGKVKKLSMEEAVALFALADKYRVEELRSECLKCIGNCLSVDNFCDIIALAQRHGEIKLLEAAQNFFRVKMEEIMKTTEWLIFLSTNASQANNLLRNVLFNKKMFK